MDREVMWMSFDGKKFEHVHLSSNSDGIRSDGLLLHLNEKGSYRIRYQIQCDAAWQVMSLALTGLDEPDQKLILQADAKGCWWNDKGDKVHTLEGCRDIDLHFSPFTNTLAIRRLALQEGERADIKVLFISFPDMRPNVARQKYACLEHRTNGSLYEYESLTSGFKTKLPVDQDGLLLEYPRYFKRIWTR